MKTFAEMKEMMLSDRVYHHILKQLLQRRIRPGELLDRRKIADELENHPVLLQCRQ